MAFPVQGGARKTFPACQPQLQEGAGEAGEAPWASFQEGAVLGRPLRTACAIPGSTRQQNCGKSRMSNHWQMRTADNKGETARPQTRRRHRGRTPARPAHRNAGSQQPQAHATNRHPPAHPGWLLTSWRLQACARTTPHARMRALAGNHPSTTMQPVYAAVSYNNNYYNAQSDVSQFDTQEYQEYESMESLRNKWMTEAHSGSQHDVCVGHMECCMSSFELTIVCSSQASRSKRRLLL